MTLETRRQLLSQGLKWCCACKQSKPLASFGMCKGKPQSWCKICQGNSQRASPNRKACVRKSRYGILEADFRAMFLRQEGLCAICGGPPVAGRLTLSVDHCHLTGKVRGLLCQHCNLGLGYFKDSETRLTQAVNYIRSSLVS